MNTTAHTAQPSTPAPGLYAWTRPGVAVRVLVAANGATAGTVETARWGVEDVPEDLAAEALAEVLAQQWPHSHTPAAPVTLTRQRARAMHKTLAALGLPADARYTLASEVVRRDVQSLTALTEQEARAVWLEACAQARAAADLAAAEQAAAQTDAEWSAQAEEWLR